MMHFYSASTRGFYDSYHTHMPADAVEITAEHYKTLHDAQAMGFRIRPDAKGMPAAVPYSVDEVPLPRQAAWLMYQGVTIESAKYPLANGVYACDDASVTAALNASLHIKVHGQMLGGGPVLDWPDKEGHPHSFGDKDVFLAFSAALSNHNAKLKRVVQKLSTELPPAIERID
jgi:hypothetical protein